jgi:hypothetical protein
MTTLNYLVQYIKELFHKPAVVTKSAKNSTKKKVIAKQSVKTKGKKKAKK